MTFHEGMTPTTHASRFRLGAFGLLVAGSLVLAGCGGAASSPAGASAAAPTQAASVPADAASADAPSDAPSDAPAASADAAASSDAAGGACGDAVAAITSHVANASITNVTVIGPCAMAIIETSLDGADFAGGVAICEKAGEVAYPMGIGQVTVVATDNNELALGLKTTSCIPNP